jgi:magnesium transporter
MATQVPQLNRARQELILSLMKAGESDLLGQVLSPLQPEDIAEWLPSLPPEDRREILNHLPLKSAGEILDHVDPAVRPELVRDLPSPFLGNILGSMPPEEAADVIAEMKPLRAPAVLQHLPEEDSREIKQILAYPENSAGRIMDPDLIAVDRNATVQDTIRRIKSSTIEETLFSVFVTGEEGRLVGIVPLGDLLTAPAEAPLGRIMTPVVATVTPQIDQEEAARLVKKYDLTVLPVVDEQGRPVGRVTADDVMDVIDEEASEDIFRMAGTDDEELRVTSALRIARIRMPWLFICMGGSFFSGLVIKSFELTLARMISLVAFIPMITSTGGNVGLQSSTIVIRSLALGTLPSSRLLKLVVKQIKVGILLGLACGAFLAVVAFFWGDQHPGLLGTLVGVAMLLAVTFSTLSGMFIPLVFDRLKIDPAIASGPLITTLNDVLGITIYLTSASLMIKYFL